MNKIEKLIEKKVEGVAFMLSAIYGRSMLQQKDNAKQILFGNNLAIIVEKELPKIHYGSYMSIKNGDKKIEGWELHERRMREEGFTHSIIILKETN